MRGIRPPMTDRTITIAIRVVDTTMEEAVEEVGTTTPGRAMEADTNAGRAKIAKGAIGINLVHLRTKEMHLRVPDVDTMIPEETKTGRRVVITNTTSASLGDGQKRKNRIVAHRSRIVLEEID